MKAFIRNLREAIAYSLETRGRRKTYTSLALVPVFLALLAVSALGERLSHVAEDFGDLLQRKGVL